MVVKRKTNPRIRSTKNTRPQSVYRKFLRTKYWKEVRKLVLVRDGFKCVICSSAKQLQVHHLNYKFIYKEKEGLHTLVTICRDCHRKEHKLK